MSRVHDDRPGSTAPDGVTDRFLDLAECAAATSFLPEQYNYLCTRPFDRALKIISAAVTVGMLHAIYLTIVAEHMLTLDSNTPEFGYVLNAHADDAEVVAQMAEIDSHSHVGDRPVSYVASP